MAAGTTKLALTKPLIKPFKDIGCTERRMQRISVKVRWRSWTIKQSQISRCERFQVASKKSRMAKLQELGPPGTATQLTPTLLAY